MYSRNLFVLDFVRKTPRVHSLQREDLPMRLYIIRHGETKLNALGCLQGWTDEPLNKSGRDLAVITGEAIKKSYDCIGLLPMQPYDFY